LSGIGGIVRMDGGPVDDAALRRMAACLAFRGPDGAGARADSSCGLAHASMRTGAPGDDLPQPATLGGGVWTIADARIDGRGELVRLLRGAGRVTDEDASDAVLVLHAYAAWGDACLDRLIGDFAFAVWDGPRRRLFCARDHFGVKPLYHAARGGLFIFSNTLECVRAHPGLSSELDEGALADFLVQGHLRAPDATPWAAVRALPPGHALVVEDGEVRVSRYWSLPLEGPELRYRRVREYVDHFVDVLGHAVRDRMPRSGGTALLMSGGRDSTAVAALAREAVGRGRRNTELRAYTAVYDRLLPDRERHFASLAGAALRIPVRFTVADDYAVHERAEELLRPLPVDSVLMAIEADQLRQAEEHARVVLTGLGADPALRETPSRLTSLVARGRVAAALGEAAQYAWWHRRVPRPGIRTYLKTRGRLKLWRAQVPAWIDPGFARRVELEARVAAQNARPLPAHPRRPEAYAQLADPLWPSLFTEVDPGATGILVEERHPFFDVRVIGLLLSIPPAQWYNDKGLLRMGMHGRLPAAVVRRPKTPLAGDPLRVRREIRGDAWLGGRTVGAEVAPWVRADRLSRAVGGAGPGDGEPLWLNLRPLSLSLWLRAHGR
jgi:asparagine synthase (glutamine-hydrolysing)